MGLDRAERDTSERRGGSGHERLVRYLFLLRRGEMLVDCAGFYSRDRAKQRLEHFLEREREPMGSIGGLEAG